MLGSTSQEFATALHAQGIARPEALAAYRQVFRDGNDGSGSAQVNLAPIVNSHKEFNTTKFIQRHHDGLETESVILPIASSTGRLRNTLCVSSQVGCAMGCTFCETAQMGLMKNLTAAQIVGQWFAARFLLDTPIHNIVFMGMGEPMDNLDSVIQAIRVLTDQNGPSIAPARISVSTVGRTEGILRLAELARTDGFRKLRLAVSINAPNDTIRSQIMPINRATPMARLMDAMLQWPTDGRQRVLIEYVLIPGVNDAPEHAAELCEYLRPLKCTVNVIPYNPRRHSPWPAPSEDSVRDFVQRIHDCGQFVKRRQTLGRSVMAACGQLGNPMIRKRKFVGVRTDCD
jgi:23S rRNA (adenine2503-C2)-methyltransferase